MILYNKRRSLSPQPSITYCKAIERGSTVKRSLLTLKNKQFLMTLGLKLQV